MQFESLKVFCDIIRLKSFSKGAAENRLTQSAASQIVHALEEHFDAKLIDRSTRPLHPTPVGQLFYEGCRDIVDRFQRLEMRVRNGEVPIDSNLEIAAIYSIGMGDLEDLATRFEKKNPQTDVHVGYHHPDEVYERVRSGEVDLGLLSFPRKDRGSKSLLWREERMMLACVPGHRLAEFDEVPPKELAGERFVAFQRGLTIRRQVDKYLRNLSVSVDIQSEFDNIETIKQAISEGRPSIALLPEPTLAQDVQAGSLVARPVQGKQLFRPLSILYSRHHQLSPTAQRFIDLLRQNGSTALSAVAHSAQQIPGENGEKPAVPTRS